LYFVEPNNVDDDDDDEEEEEEDGDALLAWLRCFLLY